MAEVTVEFAINESEWRDFVTSEDVRDALQQVGGAVTPRVITKTGRKSGELQGNTGHAIFEDEDGLVLAFGTGIAPGTERKTYDIHHWTPGKPGGPRASWPGTRAWSRTLTELGIEFERTVGYDV